jgi:transglutaminase-like putative cysteine protease
VNYQLITSHNPSERAEYKIASYPNYNTGYITRTEYKDNLQLPDVIPARVLELAERLKNDSPEIFIENVLGYFRNENFSYTLSPPTMSENPIETFLFDEKKGFCSHYAAAFVYLMRVREIPARIVGGYQGGELNQVGNFLEIRQANAHAWAEVWLKNKGWVRVDPTTAILPERVEQNVNVAEQIETGEVNFDPITIESQEQLNWLRTARHLWENVDYSWQRWVINYNNQHQAKFLKTMGIHNLQAMMYWLLYCIALIVTLSAWFLLKNKYQETDEAFIIYQKFCRKLEKNGLIRKPAEGFKDFAQRCSNEMPNVSAQISEVTGLFLQFRYEKNCSTPENLKKLRKTANQKISQKSEDY